MPLATSGGQIKHWSIGKFGVRDFNWMNATERNGRKMWNGGNEAIKQSGNWKWEWAMKPNLFVYWQNLTLREELLWPIGEWTGQFISLMCL